MKLKIGRPPEYRLLASRKLPEGGYSKSVRVGAGWLSEGGSISIKIDDFVVLPMDGTLALSLHLDKASKTELEAAVTWLDRAVEVETP